MPAKPLELTEKQKAWGVFYARLHALAEQIRQEQRAAQIEKNQVVSSEKSRSNS